VPLRPDHPATFACIRESSASRRVTSSIQVVTILGDLLSAPQMSCEGTSEVV
jgi:hypothetical protein